MSETEDAQHPFRCYTLDDNNERKTMVGGSYDEISAVTIACAVYAVAQGYSASTWRNVIVVDSTEQIIAVIGGTQEQVAPQTEGGE